jgi:hypothetical protein
MLAQQNSRRPYESHNCLRHIRASEVNDGSFLICIQCQRSVPIVPFGAGVKADFADVPGFNSKHFASPSCRERHTAFDECEIMKQHALLISGCAGAPFLGMQ